MAKVYALKWFKGRDGVEHQIGDEFDLPRETAEEKQEFDQLLDYGVVTRSEVKANPTDSEDSETERPQRSRRARN